MKQEKFDEIYKNVIIHIKRDVDKDNICEFKFRASDRIFNTYQYEKYKLKKYFMNNEEDNIDRHKIAACMMYSIMKISPLYVPINRRIRYFFQRKRFSVIISYINEYLALLTALSILDNFYNQDVKEGVLDPRRRKITIPQTFNDDYGFIFNTCIDLKFGKVNNSINILTYASLFFLLEYDYTQEKQECKN